MRHIDDKFYDKFSDYGMFYIGDDYTTISYTSPNIKNGRRIWKDMKDDIVYFMFVDGILKKIGQSTNWSGRIGTYERGIHGDATNNRIISIMEGYEKNKIEILAIKVDRMIVSVTCPVTNETLNTEVSLAEKWEKHFTNKALELGIDLPFCNQLK